ncbi:hypothetical protein NQ318_015593 [Aromia moschata]|uniref:BED-type domain-containing protein n=1 Tax=Aromia moschata TaxID=1265417 RepID=A0AAV8X422_9CUCU|nr:hypothetical protein NQ318_015593 [Aromia moschata]
MAESNKKCRQYSVNYLKFGFIPSLSDKQLPMCLLCNKVLSNDAMKPSKLEDHLRRCHPDKIDKVQKRPTVDKMFASTQRHKEMVMVCERLTYFATYGKIRKIAYYLVEEN